MGKFVIPKDIEKDAYNYMKYVVETLEDNGILQDDAALTMLARNYSTFIKAQKQVEKEGITVTSDRGNIAEHPAVKISRDA